MGTATVKLISGRRLLDSAETLRLLSDVVEGHVALELIIADAMNRSSITGAMQGFSATEMTIQLDGPAPDPSIWRGGIPVEVRLELDQKHYSFGMAIGSVVNDRAGGTIHLDLPLEIWLSDRRKSSRRNFREATSVTLCLDVGDRTNRCPATLLNLSVDGLACRISTEHGALLDRNSNVRAILHLPELGDPVEITARITNSSPGSTSNQLVLGMEFVDSVENATSFQEIRNALQE